MTERTLLSFDSAFRELWPEEEGVECLRLMDGGDVDRGGGDSGGDDMSAHSEVGSGKTVPLLGTHEFLLVEIASAISRSSGSGVAAKGLGDGDGAFVMIERGGKMLNI